MVKPESSTRPTGTRQQTTDYLQNLDQNVLETMADRQRQRVKETNKKVSVPAISVADSINWTPELEKRAKEVLEDTKDVWVLPDSLRNDYLSLFKTALLYTGRSPRDIVGVQTQLCFALDSKSRALDYTPHPLKAWSRKFCDRLSQLITHQAWDTKQPGGRAACLATALQYAVILRTRDKREWWMRGPDSFLEGIQSAVKSGASPREAHAKMRASLFVRGDFIHTYHISNVFDALEKIVKERREQIIADSPYYVTTDDLAALTQALDSLSDSETCCIGLSTEIYYKMAMAVRPMRGLKPAGNELDTFHEKIMLEECRRMLLHEHVVSRNDRGCDTVDGAEPFASTSLIAPHSTAQTEVESDADPAVDTNSEIFDDSGDNLACESSMSGSVTPGQTRLLEVPATPERQGRADGKRPQQALVERTPKRARLDYDDAEEVELGVSLTASVKCEAINAEKARKAEEVKEAKAEEARKATEATEATEAKEVKESKEAEDKKSQEALVPVREPWDFELPCDQGLDLPVLLNVLGDPPGAERRLPRPFLRDAESSLLRCKLRRHF
ncbi:hypothetical protein ACQRIU_002717 [Beauveria bassiana]